MQRDCPKASSSTCTWIMPQRWGWSLEQSGRPLRLHRIRRGRACDPGGGWPELAAVSLELGGKGPPYVRDNADLAHAIETLVDGVCFNLSRSSCGIERICVEERLFDDFVARAKSRWPRDICWAIHLRLRPTLAQWSAPRRPTSPETKWKMRSRLAPKRSSIRRASRSSSRVRPAWLRNASSVSTMRCRSRPRIASRRS